MARAHIYRQDLTHRRRIEVVIASGGRVDKPDNLTAGVRNDERCRPIGGPAKIPLSPGDAIRDRVAQPVEELIRKEASVGDLPGPDMDLGNGGCVFLRGSPDFGHERYATGLDHD